MLVAFVVALALVPVGRGRLGALADVRLRRWWLLAIGLGLQVAALAGVPTALGAVLHAASYVAGGAYLFSNLHLPGVLWVAVGAGLNLVGIAVNGGTLPASLRALRAAGLEPVRGAQYVNSGFVEGARLPFLGDVFAIPRWLPLSNVFSLGDVVIGVGIFVALHRLTESRLVPAGSGAPSALVRRPRARALWTAQSLGWAASWTFACSVIVLTVGRPGALASAVALGLCGSGTALLLGGPLVDRFNPPALLACCAFGQACAAALLLIAPRPGLVGPAAVLIGFLAGLARPAALVLLADAAGGAGRLVAAVGLIEATLAGIGLLLAGVPVPDLLAAGARPILAGAAVLWGVAALAWSVMPAPRRPAPARATLWRDLLQAVRSVEDTPVLARLALLMAALGGGVGLAASDSFVALGLTWRRATPLGLGAGCLAVGAGLGALAATGLQRRKAGVLGPALVGAGLGLFWGAAGGDALWALPGWAAGGTAVGLSSVVLIAMALSLAPPALQGRVLAFGLGAVLVGLGTGYTLGGSLTEAGGPVAAAAGAGAVLVAAGVSAAAMTRSGSVPEAGIDQPDQLLAQGEAPHIVLEESEQQPVGLPDRGIGDVRSDEAVVELPQGVSLREGLRVGDVEGGRAQFAGAERVDQVVGDDVRAPGDVDQVTARPHGEHFATPEDAAGVRGQGERDDDQIRALERVEEPTGVKGPCRTCQWLGLSADDCCLHGEGLEQPKQRAGDSPTSEQRDAPAVESSAR